MNGPSPPLPSLPERPRDSHKGHYGRALLIGGSTGMSGAIALSGLAALRSGAGLVTLAVPEPILPTVAAHEPSYMTVPLPADDAGRIAAAARETIAERASHAQCVAVGPGLGRGSQLTELVAWMYEALPQPLVIDADGLFALSQQFDQLKDPAGPRVLTPHPGEFRRLVASEDPSRYHSLAVKLAARRQIVVLLKGNRTLITDGTQTVHNTTGNPGMATGGTGDVLTGVITALICQQLSPFEATCLAAHVHGRAGDLAAEQLGLVSMIASDLIQYLPSAFTRLENG